MKKLIFTFLLLLPIFIGNAFSQSWQEVSSGTTYILYGISFPPNQNNTGYAAGMREDFDTPGVIIKTTDGGETWSTILPLSGDIDGLRAICFIDENIGFAGGWNNYFIKTVDGGATWANVTLGNNIWYFTDIEFWDESNGVASATMNDGSGKIFVTADGGNVWSQASGITTEISDIDYADADSLYAVGSDNKILKSTNGGMNWSSIYQTGAVKLGVSFANVSFGVVGGEDGAIYTTTDGGSTWSESIAGTEDFWAVYAFSGDSANVAGTNEDIYKTIDSGATWALEYDGASQNALYKVEFTKNGTGIACGSGGQMLRKDPPLGADFVADVTEICTGGFVSFTDLSTNATSWSWTFEGGVPAFSLEQNPTVVYADTGTFNIELMVSDGVTFSTLLREDYISVLTAPEKASAPAGEIELCGGMAYVYTTDTIDFAQNYTWTVAPPAAGTFEGNGTEVIFQTSDNWVGNFIIKVKATNTCGDGEWSNNLACELFLSPTQFNLTGGGEICEGDPGVEIGLQDSESDVDYELWKNDTATGILVAGTGEAISFGLFTEEGTYSATGSNGICDAVMIGDTTVVVNMLPAQLTKPLGEEEVCNINENVYTTTGVVEFDTIIWTLSPEEAGTILNEGLTASITWNVDYDSVATLSAQAANSCGSGLVSEELEIHVFSKPSPELTGSDLVCVDEEAEYFTVENESSNYYWEVIGGAIIDGEGTNQISVLWSNTPGQGFVIITESLVAGCSAIDVLMVAVDDCTGIEDKLSGNDVRVYPNPTQSNLNLEYSAEPGETIVISVYSSIGQLVIQKEEKASSQKQTSILNVEQLPKGMYVVTINTSKNQIWKGKFNRN